MNTHPIQASPIEIEVCAAQATESAYLKAWNSGKEIATLINGRVVNVEKMSHLAILLITPKLLIRSRVKPIDCCCRS